MQSEWDVLLEKLGVVKTFADAGLHRQEYNVDDETLLKIINSLGFNLKSTADSGKLLAKLEKERWLYALEPIYVVTEKNKVFDVVLPKDLLTGSDIKIARQGEKKSRKVQYEITIKEEKTLGKTQYARAEIKVSADLLPEYYDIVITADGNKYHTLMAVTPDKCYGVENLPNLWGFAIQLYSLNSRRNWGVGDFTDLADFVKMCAQNGADVIGVNPLNVLFHDFPENASPYSSISRLFLNPIYIDVEKVAGYKAEYLSGKAEILANVRNADNIDYTTVYNLKNEVLQKIFSEFRQNKKSAEYKKFTEYCRQKGNDLENLATYQAIYSEYCHKVYGGWRAWPKELQNPHSEAVQSFQKQHQSEIMYFKYLQFLADEQLAGVYAQIKESGLKIGLYRDLPVGLCKDSAELWAENDLFIKDCGAGAPPDAFFPKGQKWCLGAFNPYKLKAVAYLPFLKILRAAMQNAGALRIDHVMSLMRLYIIPDTAEAGTYVYYNFDDMLGLVALESYLHKCAVVGESIGNVPEGFIEKLHARGIYSLSVLWAERWNGYGDFRLPSDFPHNAFCSVGTHDMAPLKMRWFGYDIETMYNLKMISENERHEQYKVREDERRRLLGALDYTGVWPKDKPRQGDCLYGEGYPNGLPEATENYVASACCKVYLAQLEDIFGVELLQNLPGANESQHPNWRRRLPVKTEDYQNNADFIRIVEIIRQARTKCQS